MLSGQVVILKKPYKFGEVIGSGGFSTVYSAKDNDGRPYAIKVLNSENEGIPCLMEASIMMTLRHPYLNTALDTIVVDDILYIVQEKADCDLREWIRDDKRFVSNEELAKNVAWQIGNALEFLHREQYIHGDLKSSNILVYGRERGTSPTYKITDFNLSTQTHWKKTKDVCTDSYRPLEGWEGTKWDTSIDIWCLGCVLYHCRYKKHLFQAQGDSSDQRVDKDPFLNALYDWELVYYKNLLGRPPKRNRTDKQYNSPEIESSIFRNNDPLSKIILAALHPVQTERPTATTIVNNSLFTGLPPINGSTIRPYLLNASSARSLPRISALPPNFSPTLPPSTTERTLYHASLAESIYRRYESHMTDEPSLVRETAIMMAAKITRNNDISFNTKDLKTLFRIERDICRKLNFVLI